MSIRPCFKHGIGKLTAAAEGAAKLVGDVPRPPPTFLTQVSHKAPMRFVPLRQSSIAQAGAAVCAMSNYGGGMVQGDSLDLTIHAQTNARLGVTTQGASRIYTPNHRGPPTKSTLQATVDPDALLVWAPDPCSLFRSSSFQQRQTVRLHPTSSLALIDWFSSGRYRNGEQWAFDSLSAQTSLRMMLPPDDKDSPEEVPFLHDAVHLHLSSDVPNAQQSLGVSEFQTFASLILYGDQVEQVAQQCRFLSDALLSQHTRIRISNTKNNNNTSNDDSDAYLDASPSGKDLLASLGLSGRVCMGISEVPLPASITASSSASPSCSSVHVVRLAAMTNEDLYRVFHHCLLPLQDNFGMQFYKERIRAQASEIPPLHAPTPPEKPSNPPSSTQILTESTTTDASSLAPAGSGGPSWAAYMLADSALPTGSFAHSAGLEVAAQTGWISPQSSASLESYIYAATRSSLQQTTPLIMSGHVLSQTITSQTTEQDGPSNDTEWPRQWKELQNQAQSVLASNGPACAASLDQGKSLARVAQQWLREDVISTLQDSSSTSTTPPTNLPLLLSCFQETPCHIGVIWGGLCAALGLSASDAVHLYGYCVARDMVSAAVRLSLVGPLASVGTLHRVQQAGKDGWDAYVQRVESLDDDEQKDALSNPCLIAATSAPVLEAIHPCHDSLQVRLFRS
eukprot:Nitzschia sp. Nitz4//scaffold73_size107353//52647//54683//NITZ4_004320-RA/size107353-processed-gene-0.26-mRNA-1//-1//CDS//3329557476//5799//frame0